MAKSSASLAANRSVATAEALAVRNCPRANASMIALRDPVSLSNKISSGVAPPLVWAQVLVPANCSFAKTAPIACSVAPSPQATCVFTMFFASPRASANKAFFKAVIASPISMLATTAASEIQSGDDTDIMLWRKLSVCAIERRRHRRLEREAVSNQSMHNVTPNQHQYGHCIFVTNRPDH